MARPLLVVLPHARRDTPCCCSQPAALTPALLPCAACLCCPPPCPGCQRLGADLGRLEGEQAALSERLVAMTQAGAALDEVVAVSNRLAELQAGYEAKEERWLELADIAGDI